MMRRPNPASTVACLALTTLLIGACRQIVGIEDQPFFNGTSDSGTPSTCGALSFGNASCEACMVASCCAESESCAGAAGCGDLVDCLGACDPHDAGCASACRARLNAGDHVEAASVRSCEAVRCAAECELVCGGYVYASEACATCGVAHCCGATTACMNDRECASLVSCERACADADDDCLAVCELGYPNGVALERAMGACTEASCAGACIAPRWACLVNQVPPALPPPVTISYNLHDYASGQPLVGFSARGCRSTDLACATTVAGPATTNSTGTVVLQLPNGFDGYVEVSGAGYGAILLFAPPLSLDLVATLPLPTQSAILLLISAVTAPDPASGLVVAVPFDCATAPAPGVRFTLMPSDGSTPFYFANTIPSATATATDDNLNGFIGGGFVNAKANTALHVGTTVVENSLAFPDAVLFTRPGGTSIVLTYAGPK